MFALLSVIEEIASASLALLEAYNPIKLNNKNISQPYKRKLTFRYFLMSC